jgi:hypothetical protein
MNYPDPALNKARLFEDFLRLSQRDAVGKLVTQAITHSAERDLIAVFEGNPDPFEVGRVQLFQEFIYGYTGIFPEVAGSAAHCIKVFFNLGEDGRAHRSELGALFASEAFDDIIDGLEISYVQLGGQIFPPQRLKS